MKKIAVIVIMVLCITACDSGGGGDGNGERGDNNGLITLSGSVFVSINGVLKRYAQVTIYGDSELTDTFGDRSGAGWGSSDKGHTGAGARYLAGDYRANDYDIYITSESPRLPDGEWVYYIKKKILVLQ
jgi:hypothetical protein